jgi:hypothetical protein
MKSGKNFLRWLLALMLMGSVQLAVADDNRPRIILPTVDIDDGTIGGSACITEKHPYFTVYVWCRNCDHVDSYWESAPTLSVDGRKVTLSFMSGNHGWKDSKDVYEYTCWDGDKVYYTVRTRPGFEVNSLFLEKFPKLKDYSNTDQDGYVPVDIYMHENHPGDVHTVSVRGKAHLDNTTDYFDAWDLDGNTSVSTLSTKCPTALVVADTELKWKTPGKLTFTSARLKELEGGWGGYRVGLDDKVSERVASGTASVTKEYSNPNYKEDGSYTVSYRYEGVYDPENPQKQYNENGTAQYYFVQGSFFSANIQYYWGMPENCYMTFSRDIDCRYIMYYDNNPMTITLHAADKRFCKVEVVCGASVFCSWEDWTNPQETVTLTTPGKGDYFTCIRVTFDRSLSGYSLEFVDSASKGATTLPYPSNLSASGNVWNKNIRLTWSASNANVTNRKGTWNVYRDNQLLTQILGDVSYSNFSYDDENVEYDKWYNYSVYFQPDGWDGIVSDLSASTGTSLNRTISLSGFTVQAVGTGYQLDWSIGPELDRSGYVFDIYRKVVTADNPNISAADYTSADKIGSVKVDNAKTLSYSYTDEDISTTATYAYMVKIDNIQESSYHTDPTIPNGRPNASQIEMLMATHGTYTDHVHLEWQAMLVGDDYLVYDIYRHQIGEGENSVTSAEEMQQLQWIKVTSLTSTKSAPVTTYDDYNATPGYYYAYAVIARANGSNDEFTRKMTDAFVRSTGTVYGSITYQNGDYAVEGVKVTLQSDATTSQVFNALQVNGGKSGVLWTVPEDRKSYFTGQFSAQMYVEPEAELADGTCLLDMGGRLRLSLGSYNDGGYLLTVNNGSESMTSAHRIQVGQYTHLTVTYDGSGNVELLQIANDSLVADTFAMKLNMGEMGNILSVATQNDTTSTLKGCIDDVRFFNYRLLERDVKQNYNHFLGGTEDGLVVYWTFDEGVSDLRNIYDYSKTGEKQNNNDAKLIGGTRSNQMIPSPDQLSLFGMTDTKGAYTVSGIPFMGVGTTYSIIPTKGVHKFNPTKRTVYVSPTTLTFDPQNFEDQSSFNVSGVVYYEHTTYPVKDCTFRVDDVIVKDDRGNVVKTDAEGKFSIPVSIGDHVLYVEKKGHTFLNAGRYPETGTYNFNDSVSHLTFTDLTKAIVVGRVVGGAEEKVKPLGFGASKANIGAATLTLLTSSTPEDARRMNVYLDKDEGTFESNPDTLFYELASDRVSCQAWAGGTKDGVDQEKYITIKTDPKSGEFAVLLPPAPYYISTRVDNNAEASAYFSDKVLLDCSNVLDTISSQLVLAKDTLGNVTESLTFKYNVGFSQTYMATPVITVEQTDNSVGAFGDEMVPAGELGDSVMAYTVQNDTLTYKYGYPIFTGGYKYNFKISSFERYMNYDGGVAESEREQRVPTTTGYLTLNNPWVAADADTLDRVRLDSLGTYTYSFQPIEPNLVPPYTQPLSIRLDVGNNTYSWDWKNGDYEGTLQGIVFSSKVTGNTSVTKAPDKIVNILPDPFGSNSNQVWKAGSSHNLGFKLHVQGAVTLGSDIMNETGSEVEIAEGAPGLYIYSGMSLEGGRGKGLSWKGSLDTDGGVSWQFATEEDFATSTSPYYDGPKGDLFIGVSTSLIYGDGMEVRLMDQQDGTYAVGTREVICTGEQIGTEFAYTQDHIINHLIPNYKRLREARLREVSTDSLKYYQEHFRNLSDSVIYMTDILPSDPRYGTNNDDSLVWGDEAIKDWKLKYNADSTCYYGPSYTAFLPVNKTYKNEEEIWDAILTINSDIQLWEYYLISNEFRKVMAFQDNDNLKKTYSFDSGSGVTYSNTTGVDSNESLQLSSNLNHYRKLAMEFEGNNGVVKEMKGSFNLTFDLNGSAAFVAGTHSSDTYVVNLNDPTPDNFHEVQIYELDSKGYIFRQTDGQTSQCYEGEERTKFYFPDQYILSAATVQIETPQIDCDQPVQTGVPIGEPAVFKLKLTNPTLANVTRRINFALMVEDDKWGQMSEVTINGAANAHNYEVSMAPGETFLVTLKVKPYDLDVVHIDSLHMTFYSQGEPSISDDIYLSAHFQPAAEPVTLASSRTLVNTATDSTLVLTAAGYSINSSILNAVRLQQRKAGAPDWTTIHSWVKGVPSGSNESALTETIDTLVDMRSSIAYPDAEYEFRAVTDCTVGSEQVLGESNVIQVIKDVTLPKPIYLPEPADGVLGEGDNITLTFNEDIYSQSLTDVDNFIIQSVLNTDSVAHAVALRLDGTSEPAATSQSTLTLGGTSFTVCGWVKTDGAAGTFYKHGEGNNYFSVNIDADGYVALEMRDTLGSVQTYKAKEALPKSTWSYLAVIYDHQAGTITAHAAHGDQEQNLMVDIPVSPITAEGNIFLGKGLKGAMHELSLFSAALTWTTVKAQMYIGKSSATPSILGYWRLDEGHGSKSEDRARSRHMLLASANGWYLENENISLGLDTNSGVAIPLGGLSVGDNDSYLVEMWAQVDEQSSDAQLMRLDIGNKLDLMLDDGKLCLVANYNIYPTNKTLNDQQWHHLALNVLKGAGGSGASLLVDGVAVLSNINSDNIPSLAGAKLHLGQDMKGTLDEVRLWHGTNTAETISERMYYRIDGKSTPGLVGYWPMEKTYYDEYDQRVYSFSLDNMGYEATASTTLVADSANVTLAAGTSAPGLKVAPHKTNLDFSFVADERTVSVTLDHSPEALEGCTVFTTLRSYYDMHTNVGNPITWSFVVKQNALSWNTDQIDYSVLAGHEGTFTATLYNNGPADQNWSFSELPSWLEASPSSGTIFAGGSKEVTFTVKPGNTIGKYFSTVSARGKLGIDTPLDICLSVEGKKPDWTPTVYGESMTIIGQIKFDGVVSNDPNDIVAAFNEYEECVGVGHPAAYASTDACYVFLYVYGTKKMSEEKTKLSFRLYDASTGSTYPLTKNAQNITFACDGYVGSINNPVIWENDVKVLQTLPLNEHYNWVSFYVIPTHRELSQVFSPVTNQVASVEFADSTYYYDDFTNRWSGNTELNAGTMMKVQMNKDADLYVAGVGVYPAVFPITINPGTNWVGVPSSTYMTIDEAFAGLQPEEFDIVKSQSAFSQYINGKWFGNLDVIEPGKGYIYTSQATATKTFTFPGDVPERPDTVWNATPGIKANYRYPHNMAVTCTVRDNDGHAVTDCNIEAYNSKGELRGRTVKSHLNGLFLLIISGDSENEPLILKADAPGIPEEDQPMTIMNFRRDTHLGSYNKPFVIGGPRYDGIANTPGNSTLAVYNASGVLLYKGYAANFDRKRIPANEVLIVVETKADGTTSTYKLK